MGKLNLSKIKKEITPFDINNERCKILLDGFLDHGYTKTVCKYLKIINTANEFTLKEIANETGYRTDSILDTLRKKQYSRFIEIKGRGINRNPLLISINSRGKEFLDIFNNLEKIYNDRFG